MRHEADDDENVEHRSDEMSDGDGDNVEHRADEMSDGDGDNVEHRADEMSAVSYTHLTLPTRR